MDDHRGIAIIARGVRHFTTGIDAAIRGDAQLTRFGRVQVPLCLPEHLVVFKAIAGRPKDLEDAEALLALYPDIDVASVRRRIAELADAPEVLDAFDVVAKRRTPSRSGRK